MTSLLDSFHNIGYLSLFIINATYNDHAPANFIFLSDACQMIQNVASVNSNWCWFCSSLRWCQQYFSPVSMTQQADILFLTMLISPAHCLVSWTIILTWPWQCGLVLPCDFTWFVFLGIRREEQLRSTVNVPFGEAGHQYFALPEPRAQSAWSGTAAAKTKFEFEISAKSKPVSQT